MEEQTNKKVWNVLPTSCPRAFTDIQSETLAFELAVKPNLTEDEDYAFAIALSTIDEPAPEPTRREQGDESFDSSDVKGEESPPRPQEVQSDTVWRSKHDEELCGQHNAEVFDRAFPEHEVGAGVRLSNPVFNDMMTFSEQLDKAHAHKNANPKRKTTAKK